MTNAQHELWDITRGDGAVIATAIHDGHALRHEVAQSMKLDEAGRLREEDPFTSRLVDIADSVIVVKRSRFEVDLNRPRNRAVYLTPEDCWGLDVWREQPSQDLLARSLQQYDNYYRNLRELLTAVQEKHGAFFVYDIHTYNHRRAGAESDAAAPSQNPEVNIGTGTMDREKWGPLVIRFMNDLRNFDFLGRNLDVRENVKFRGGQQAKWIHQNFPQNGCALAIEFKKFWMDEWTGVEDEGQVQAIRAALASTVAGVREELKRIEDGKACLDRR